METSQRLPEETDLQWFAYLCYRGVPLPRTIAAAYQKYQESETTKRSSKVNGSFGRWNKMFSWDDRAKQWDLDEEERKREYQRSVDDKKYRDELEKFRQSHLSAGRIGFKACLLWKSQLLKYIDETKPEITNLRDALYVARIVATIESTSSEQWAKSLHIDLLLQRMDEEDQFED
jgi:hypothetical protein